MNNRIADLKRIEQLALDGIPKVSAGPYYAERDENIKRLQQIARKAFIERLELELKGND